jgi:NAD(P)H-hydrate epimerase
MPSLKSSSLHRCTGLLLSRADLSQLMRPRWVLKPEEVAIIDANAEALGVDMNQLMIKAAEELLNALKGSPRPIWIICGPGNNGGDGFRLAEMIADCVVIASHPQQKTELSQRARDECSKPILSIDEIPEGEPKVLVDCLLGAGAIGQPHGQILRLMEAIPGSPQVLACDIPTGCSSGLAFNAFRTVTFIAPKANMVDADGRLLPEVGDLFIASLEIPDQSLDPGPGDLLRYPALVDDAVKGDRGRVLIIGGGPYHGAPILAGMAAQRVGVDLVHVAMPKQASTRVKWPAGLIPEPLADEEIFSDASAIIERCQSGRGVQAIVIGCGLGNDEATLAAVRMVIESCSEIAMVIDADAIAALSGWPKGVKGVVTPHQKELENWVGDITAIPELVEGHGEDRVVIITGAEDMIIASGGRGGVVSGGNPRMAMGGTGDLLAGTIGGLLALGISPWGAARLGAWLLRQAGELAGEEIGPGLVAEDVPPFLSRVLKYR